MKSIQPRKQRKEIQCSLHKKKMDGFTPEESLLLKYDRRAIPVIKRDTVKVMKVASGAWG